MNQGNKPKYFNMSLNQTNDYVKGRLFPKFLCSFCYKIFRKVQNLLDMSTKICLIMG